ncbi:plasma-membrane proton-efflux P-type ATPase [Caldisericum sp.]|uniref:plasma-membrane proton-efflux P-type ATPase n=1 Tax=Caldisericum sp. TaxID=2499687 RepID=UPI003D1211B4
MKEQTESSNLFSKNAQQMTIEEVFAKLNATPAGLTTQQAEERLKQYGLNEITEKKVSPIVKFLGYFWGPIPFMIEAAAILSFINHKLPDFFIILTLLLVNSIVGFWQENKASNAIEMLKQRLAIVSRALRDGKWQEISAKELVPGDVIRVRMGDIVPADIKLIEGDYLTVDESALTGESLPVEKHVNDVCFSGAIVKQGEMNGVVVATGMNTYFGKTAKLVEEAKTDSHFQKAILKIGDFLILGAIGLVMLILFVSLFRHEPFTDTLNFLLVLTVASIPVALPAVLSVTMAVGAIELAKKEAIVSKLVAIEEMASMNVLCSDKTGTITENKLTIGNIEPFDSFKDTDVLLFGAIASRAEDKDPIDDAILNKANQAKEVTDILKNYTVTKFKPFDPVSKRTEATVTDSSGKSFQVAKGAPQVIFSLTKGDKDTETKVNEIVDTFAQKGYRALAIAKTDEKNNWVIVGILALYDPPREDSASTIKTAQSMGVKVKMVTGDHIAIAKETAKTIGLGTNIIAAGDFLDKPDRNATTIVENADGFAQVFPEQKYHIVELLQAKGYFVGMTGDGVNDAPALKKANVGIAVAGATDAAKSAASIVLTKPGLSVIIDAIKQARMIFQRMTNYSIYRIAETIRVLLFITTSIIVFNFYPITALMIVLLALLNDAPIMTIAFDNVKYSNKPEKWNMNNLLAISTMLGIVGVFSSFGALYIGKEVFHLSTEVLQAFIYLKLSVAGHLTVFVARTKSHFWSIKPAKPLFLAVIITQTIATLIAVYGILFPQPLGWKFAGFIWAYALVMFVITDFLKVWFYKLIDTSNIHFRR